MKILRHGNSIVFICPECECKFSELPKVCYSSLGHYIAVCPECGHVCYTTEEEQKELSRR